MAGEGLCLLELLELEPLLAKLELELELELDFDFSFSTFLSSLKPDEADIEGLLLPALLPLYMYCQLKHYLDYKIWF